MTDFEIENKMLITELQALLAKYNASIDFSVGSGSDTHGLYDEKVTITRRVTPNTFKEVDVLCVAGWGINAYEIAQEMSEGDDA